MQGTIKNAIFPYKQKQMLIGPIELDEDRLPFAVLDEFVDVHNIDITGLGWTRTTHGNVYRSYRLYNH